MVREHLFTESPFHLALINRGGTGRNRCTAFGADRCSASKRFRERGLTGIGIADLMKEAGVTVGGFYKHVGSHSELVAQAFGGSAW
jgi:hypothetical protein